MAVEVVHEFGAVACEQLSVSEFAAACGGEEEGKKREGNDVDVVVSRSFHFF